MKILAVILALAIVPGFQALVIREAPDPSYKLKELVVGFRRFLEEVFVAVVGKGNVILHSKTGKAVSEQYEQLAKPLNDLDRELPTEMSEAAEVVFGVPWEIAKRGYTTFVAIDRRASPNSEQVFDALAAYLEPVLQRLSPYMEPLAHICAKIHEINQDLDAKLAQAMESLDGELFFYVKGLQEIREALQPVVDDMGRKFHLGLESINKNLKPYLKPLLEESLKYREEFQEWIESPVFPPKKE